MTVTLWCPGRRYLASPTDSFPSRDRRVHDDCWKGMLMLLVPRPLGTRALGDVVGPGVLGV